MQQATTEPPAHHALGPPSAEATEVGFIMVHVQLEDPRRQARSHAPPQRPGPVPRATEDLQVHLRVGQ
eukprot:8415481-Pyramimonas_sp.AAC.1